MKKLIVLFFFGLSFGVQATTDSIQLVNDSLKITDVDLAMKLLLKADSVRISDSIAKEVLKKQLEELRSYEKTKRKKIEAELVALQKEDSLKKIRLKHEVDSLKQSAKGYPIIIHKDTLFMVYTKIGSVTPLERKEILVKRLVTLYDSYLPKSDSLSMVDHGQTVNVFFREKIIITITELDALWFNKDKKTIASAFIEKTENDIVVYKKEKGIFAIVKKAGLVILVLLVQIFLIRLVNVLFRGKINKFLWSRKGSWFKGFKIRNYEVLNETRQTEGVILLSKALQYLIIFIQLYITIPIIFSIFPLTQRFAEAMFGYVLSPVRNFGTAFIAYVPKLITVVIVVIATRYLLKFVRYLSKEIEQDKLKIPGFYADWAKPTYNILRVFIYAFMFVVIFPYLPGSSSPVFKGVSVFLGVVFSLGSTSIIGNMIAGLVITYMRPFKIGDRIKIGEVVGNVVEKTAFVTRIRTPKKEFITIPNANVLSSNVINYSRSEQQGGLIVYTTVTIGYDVPWRQVHHILTQAAKKTSFLNLEIAPFVLQTSLDDFYVSYQLNAHTNEPNKQPAIYSELHQNIQDGFNEAGIEILSPHYRAARDGNMSTIPKDHLPNDYKVSGFKIDNSK